MFRVSIVLILVLSISFSTADHSCSIADCYDCSDINTCSQCQITFSLSTNKCTACDTGLNCSNGEGCFQDTGN